MEEEEAQEGESIEEPGEEDIIPRVERVSSSLSQPTEEGEEEEEEGREWGDISSEYSEYSSEEEDEEGLMSGALSERIQVLRNRCTTALSPPVFLQVYGYIKGVREQHNGEIGEATEKEMEARLIELVGDSNKMGYVKLVEQLLFIEECYI